MPQEKDLLKKPENGGDTLSAKDISGYLSPRYRELPVFVYRTVDSTNSEAKRLIAAGLPLPALLAADTQTAGRGRLGRSFYSPERTGIYMTLALRPDAERFHAVSVTTAAAVAVVRAVEELTHEKPGIKWVNDIYLSGKKICGILAEAVPDPETDRMKGIVVGIGVNMSTESFPEDLAEVAGSLGRKGVSRSRMIAGIAEELLRISEHPEDRSYLDEYRAHSLVLGRRITYYEAGAAHSAVAVAVDDEGGLVVETGGGTRVLCSGEISVRLPR